MFTSAAEILKASPKALFPGDEAAITSGFRKMARVWHPDYSKDARAADVFEHLVKMRDRALKKDFGPSIILTREDGTKFRMEYLTSTQGDGVVVFVGVSSVAYLVDQANSDLVDRGLNRKWKFANDDMKKEMSRFLPSFRREIKLSNGRLVVYDRTPDQVLMSDLIAQEKKIVSPHASWMVTRMLNIACYLEYAQVSHMSIAPEFLLVSLEHHAVSLTGPAMYATDFAVRPKAAPHRTIEAIPSLKDATVKIDSRIDLALIRQTVLTLLGDPSGNRIRTDPDIRQETVRWVSSAPAKTAIADYTAWEASLGVRKFVKYPKTAQDFYAAQ
jgi:hypothetical protein